METFDMFDPFIFSLWIDPDTISVLDSWGDRKQDGIDMKEHWSQVLPKHLCAWQRDTFDWCTDDNGLTSMGWVKVLLAISCGINLEKCTDEKFGQLCEYELGGSTYLKLCWMKCSP